MFPADADGLVIDLEHLGLTPLERLQLARRLYMTLLPYPVALNSHDLEPEMNFNFYFVVYAAPIRESDNYFLALRRELEEALAEGVILIEKQQVFQPSH